MSSNMTPFTDVESNGNKARTASNKPNKEKHLTAAVVILAIVLVAFIIAVIVLAVKVTKHPTSDQVCTTEGCLSTALELLHAMNTSVDPCDDFFEYACGNWYATHQGPGDNKMGVVAAESVIRQHEYVSKGANDETLPESIRNVGVAYLKCKNYKGLRDEDEIWLLETLQEVGGWPMTDTSWDENRYHWERNLARASHNLLLITPFMFNVELNMFDTNHYVLQVSQHPFHEIPPLNKEQILSVARAIGDREDDPSLEREYAKVEEFEQKLRKLSPPFPQVLDDPRETKMLTIKELSTAIPWINWLEFLRTVFGPYMTTSIHDSEPVVVFGLNYISKVLELIFQGETSKRTIANYIGASFIRSLITVNDKMVSGSLLDGSKNPYAKIEKSFLPEGISGSCLDFLQSKLSPAVDYLNYHSRKFQSVVGDMFPYYYSAMKDMIASASWLDDKTRKAANEKLAKMKYFSGFSERAKNIKLVEEFLIGLPNITENVLKNQLSISHFRFKKSVQSLRKVVNKDRWPTIEGTHSSQVNAFYVQEVNSIVIPADIQSDPVISVKRPKFWNFGGFGWVLGHELTHGFDTSGSKKDKNGNVKDWWMPQAKKEFEKRAQCIIDQYSKIPYGYDNHYVDGKQTVAENVADNGGLRQTFAAYKKWEKEHGREKVIPGFEKFSIEQLFFLSVPQLYCTVKYDPEALYERHKHDSHTPTPFRTNPALANFDEFAKAFNCKPGTRMNPAKKCVAW